MADVRLRRAYIELNARVGKYESALKSARRDNDRFDKSLRQLRQQMKTTNQATNLLAGGFSKVGGAISVLAAGFSIHRITAAVQEAASYGATLVETASSIGTTTEELERLRFAFQSDGVAQGTTDKLLRQLLRTYDEARNGVKEYRDEFERLGFTQEDFERDTIKAIDLVDQVNKGLLELQDTAAQTNVLANIAGRGGPIALAAFQRGQIADIARSDELRTTLDPERLKEIDQQILNMGQSWGVFRNSLISTFSGTVIGGLELLTAASRGLGDVYLDRIPTLREVEELSKREVVNYDEAQTKLTELGRALDSVNKRTNDLLESGRSIGPLGETLPQLRDFAVELLALYAETEARLNSFQSQVKETQPEIEVRPVIDAQALADSVRRSIRDISLNSDPIQFRFSLREIQELNKLVDSPAQLPGIFNLGKAIRELGNERTTLDYFLDSLSQTESLSQQLDRLRLDLSLENGEVTIEQYNRLRVELEAIQSLQNQGIPVDDSTANILNQRIDLLTEIGSIQDTLNNNQERTNDLLKASQFAAKRFADGLADVAFESRSVRDLVAAIAIELGKSVFRAGVINPFSNLLSGVIGGRSPINRQFGGTLLTGRNAYVINETGAERLTQTRVISANQTSNYGASSGPRFEIIVNAVDVAGIEQAIERMSPRIIEIGAELGRSLAAEERIREDV